MKAGRNELKAIVKECLLEILSEGIGSAGQSAKNKRIDQLAQRAPLFQESTTSSASIRQTQQPPRRPSQSLQEAVRREAGGDKVMESILADTARTTLAAQLQHGDASTPLPGSSSSRKGVVQQEQVNGTPEQIFGEDVASKWASLAFLDSPTKK